MTKLVPPYARIWLILALIFKESKFLSTIKDGRYKGSNAGNFKEGIPLGKYGKSASSCLKIQLLYSDALSVRGHDVTPGAKNNNKLL